MLLRSGWKKHSCVHLILLDLCSNVNTNHLQFFLFFKKWGWDEGNLLNFLEMKSSSRLQSFSCSVYSCIFKREKHTQNAANRKCRYRVADPMSSYFCNPYNTFHSLTSEAGPNCEEKRYGVLKKKKWRRKASKKA